LRLSPAQWSTIALPKPFSYVLCLKIFRHLCSPRPSLPMSPKFRTFVRCSRSASRPKAAHAGSLPFGGHPPDFPSSSPDKIFCFNVESFVFFPPPHFPFRVRPPLASSLLSPRSRWTFPARVRLFLQSPPTTSFPWPPFFPNPQRFSRSEPSFSHSPNYAFHLICLVSQCLFSVPWCLLPLHCTFLFGLLSLGSFASSVTEKYFVVSGCGHVPRVASHFSLPPPPVSRRALSFLHLR